MTATQGLILTAQNVIGKGDSKTDWQIVSTEHAKLFGEELAQVLCGARLEGLAEKYEELNRFAVEARDNFKNTVYEGNSAPRTHSDD